MQNNSSSNEQIKQRDLSQSSSGNLMNRPKRQPTKKIGRGYTPTGVVGNDKIIREKSFIMKKPQSLLKQFRDHSSEAAATYTKEKHTERPVLESINLEPRCKDEFVMQHSNTAFRRQSLLKRSVCLKFKYLKYNLTVIAW